MSVVRSLGLALLVVLAVAGWRVAPVSTAPQAPAIDPGALSSFTWRSLGLDGVHLTHVSVDSGFPYRVCAHDVSARTRCLVSGLDDAARAWEALPIDGDGPLTPDEVDGDVFYTASLRRFDRRTGQATLVNPALAEQLRGRDTRAQLAFSADGRTLFAGLRAVWRTTNAGQSWTVISPNLASEPARISALAVSPIDSRLVWAGTSVGTVHLTRDAGASWVAATPASLPPDSEVSGLDPSRFDPQSVYLTTHSKSVGALWRTRDHGASWTRMGGALAAAGGVHAVREDPFRRGLLFAATDSSVFFSIDDGESWQPLKNNLPEVGVIDLTIRDADLVIGTAGQGAWVLDDFSPLRQITTDVLRADAFLFRPPQTWRGRASAIAAGAERAAAWNAGGVAISYLVGPTLTGPLQVEIIETITGEVIRRFSSEAATGQPGDPLLARTPGLQRVVWDLRYTRPEDDAAAPPGARVLPGTYQVRLTTAPRSIRQSVAVRLDPRVRASAADLAAQRTLARAIDARRAEISRALAAMPSPQGSPSGQAAALVDSRDELRRLTRAIDEVDARPSAALEAVGAAALARAAAALDAAR